MTFSSPRNFKIISADPSYVLDGGTINGVYPTVDFGVTNDSDVAHNFKLQQDYAKGGMVF